MLNKEYPYIYKIGCEVTLEPIPHVKRDLLKKCLGKHRITKLFYDYFGIQTAYIEGLYPWDVEDVLVRIYEKKLTGTQLIMD